MQVLGSGVTEKISTCKQPAEHDARQTLKLPCAANVISQCMIISQSTKQHLCRTLYAAKLQSAEASQDSKQKNMPFCKHTRCALPCAATVFSQSSTITSQSTMQNMCRSLYVAKLQSTEASQCQAYNNLAASTQCNTSSGTPNGATTADAVHLPSVYATSTTQQDAMPVMAIKQH